MPWISCVKGIHLRAYGQTDPLRAYQLEGYEMFQNMVEAIEEEVTTYILKATITANVQRQAVALKANRSARALVGEPPWPQGQAEVRRSRNGSPSGWGLDWVAMTPARVAVAKNISAADIGHLESIYIILS